MDYNDIITTSAGEYEEKIKKKNLIYDELHKFSDAIKAYSLKEYGVEVEVDICKFRSNPEQPEFFRIASAALNTFYGLDHKPTYLCFKSPTDNTIFEVIGKFVVGDAGFPIDVKIGSNEYLVSSLEELKNSLQEIIKLTSFFTTIKSITDKIKTPSSLTESKE